MPHNMSKDKDQFLNFDLSKPRNKKNPMLKRKKIEKESKNRIKKEKIYNSFFMVGDMGIILLWLT
jgi:hypothetical protein